MDCRYAFFLLKFSSITITNSLCGILCGIASSLWLSTQSHRLRDG